MKSIKKYIALGFAISLVFAVSNLSYGVFKDSDYTSVNMKFNAELPKINSQNKKVEKSYDIHSHTYKIVISECIYEGRKLYKDESNKEIEELKFKLNANQTPLEGADVIYTRNGKDIKIIIEKRNYNNNSTKHCNLSIQPYLVKAGGGTLNIDKEIKIFLELEKSNNNQSIISPSGENTEETDRTDNIKEESTLDKDESSEESSDKKQETNKEEISTEENMTQVIENPVE